MLQRLRALLFGRAIAAHRDHRDVLRQEVARLERQNHEIDALVETLKARLDLMEQEYQRHAEP